MFGEKKGFFGRMSERINDALMMNPTIDEDFFDELEEILITSDIGIVNTHTAMSIHQNALNPLLLIKIPPIMNFSLTSYHYRRCIFRELIISTH